MISNAERLACVGGMLILLTSCAAPVPQAPVTSALQIAPDRLYFIDDAAPSLQVVRRAIDAAIRGDESKLPYVISFVQYIDGEGAENYGDLLNNLQRAVTPQRFQRVLTTLDPKIRQMATDCMDVAQHLRKSVKRAIRS